MQHLALRVIEQVLGWFREGKTVWLCTALATFGSSPHAPGSGILAALIKRLPSMADIVRVQQRRAINEL